MDRSNKYVRAIQTEEVGYRDYFAEFVSLLCRTFASTSFRFAFSLVAFLSGLLFTVGIVGGIERELIPYACAIPLGFMLVCVSLLLNKLRK